jgi:putative ABC transport system permease protein
MFLIVRSDLPSAAMVEPVRRAVRELDSELPLANVRPLDAVAGAAISARRLALSLVATFGLVALFLAVIGIYGVIAQAVQQRSREFGVRQALGATRGDIMRIVFSSGAVLTVTGLLGGIALALVSTRLLTALLYGVTPLDLPTFAGVAIILLASATGAAYVPARRATRISAAAALRD